MSETVQITSRLPESLFNWLKETAVAAKRSMNAQISVCLTFLRHEQKAGRYIAADGDDDPQLHAEQPNLLTLRMPHSLANWLKYEAGRENRSVNGQLVYALGAVKRMMESPKDKQQQVSQVSRQQRNNKTLVEFAPPATPDSPYRRVLLQFPSDTDLSKLYLTMTYAPDDLINELEKLRLIHRIQNSIEQLDVTQIIAKGSGSNLNFDTQTSGGRKMDVAWNVMMTLDGDLIVSEPSGQYKGRIEDDVLRSTPVTVEQVQDVLTSALDAIRDYSDDRLTDRNSDDGYQLLSADICSAIYAVHSLVDDISDEDLRVESDDTPASNHNKRPKP